MSLLSRGPLKAAWRNEGRFWPQGGLLRRVFSYAGAVVDGHPKPDVDAWRTEGAGIPGYARAVSASAGDVGGCARAGCPGLPPHASTKSAVPLSAGRRLCSLACLEGLLESEVRRALKQRDQVIEPYQHRLPLGLLMLSRRWVTHDQLRRALLRQKREGYGRLGEWLIALGASDEATVAKALAAQWGIAVLSSVPQTGGAVLMVPRLLVEASGIVPVRLAAGRILYVAIDHEADATLNLAIEQMTGLRVEPVAMPGSVYRRLRREALQIVRPPIRHGRTTTVPGLLDAVLAIIEEQPTRNLQLTRWRDYFWLRLERQPHGSATANAIEDCILTCSGEAPGDQSGEINT